MSNSKNPLSSPIIKFFWLFILALAGMFAWSYIREPESKSSLTDDPVIEQQREILINVDDIAGKPPEEVASVLGQPTGEETVNPSGTSCPCEKLIYKDGKVEIVYMNGIADWITANYPPANIADGGPFLSVDQFPSYTYVKVKTP